MLSQRIRSNVEAAQWVIEGVKRLEAELAAAYDELNKQRPKIKAVFDRDVWVRADLALGTGVHAEMRLVNSAQLDQLLADAERMSYVCSVTRCDPKMDGNHIYFGIGGRVLKGHSLRLAIDNELIRMYGSAQMPK